MEKFGIINQNIVLSKSNLAYILSRHVGEYDISAYDKMNEVIEKYDVVLQGRNGNNDFLFYKLFENIEGKKYGIEVVIDRKSKNSDEYIVHMNYISYRRNRASKYIDKYKQKHMM